MYIHNHILSKRWKGATASSSLPAGRNSTAGSEGDGRARVCLSVSLCAIFYSFTCIWMSSATRKNKYFSKKNEKQTKKKQSVHESKCQGSGTALSKSGGYFDCQKQYWRGERFVTYLGSGTGRKLPPRLGSNLYRSKSGAGRVKNT